MPRHRQQHQGTVNGVLGPPILAGRELFTDLAPSFSGADETKDGRADEMLFRIALETEGVQGVAVALFGPFDDLLPPGVVGQVKLRVKARQRVPGGLLDPVLHEHPGNLVAARHENPRAVDDLGGNALDLRFSDRFSGLDGGPRFQPLGCGGRALDVQGLFGGFQAGHGLLQLIRQTPGDVNENERTIGASLLGLGHDGFFVHRPAVPHPHRHALAGRDRGFGAGEQLDLAGDFAVPVDNLEVFQIGALGPEQVGPFAGDPGVVVNDPVQVLSELGVPTGAFRRLQPVFLVHHHELPDLDQGLEPFGHPFPQIRASRLQVFDQQIGQHFRRGPDTEVGSSLAGQFVNEEDQGADPGAEPAVRAAIVQDADHLVDLGLEDAGLEEVSGFDPIDRVTAHNGFDRTVGIGTHGFVNDAELIS